MVKVAIKNENFSSFGGIYHIMDVFSKLGFEKLTESVLGKRGSSGKAFYYGSIFGSHFFSYLCGGECLEDINALIGSSSRDLITQNATRLISRKTPGRRQSYSSPKSTPFSLLLPQCTERAQRAHVARASAVFRLFAFTASPFGDKQLWYKGLRVKASPDLPSPVKAKKRTKLHPQVANYQRVSGECEG